jgi:hypothetical protein
MVLHSPITRNHMHIRPAITPRMATLVRITMGARTGILGPAFVGIVVAGLCALVLLPATDAQIADIGAVPTVSARLPFPSRFAACWPKTYQHYNPEQEDYGREYCHHD